MSMKINKLEIENVKRVKAVRLEPKENGLTVIGGKNGQGKTSVLDAIAWGLGGKKHEPSQAQREGSVTPPNLRIVMSNGLVVERSGKNSALKVIDPSGKKAGQGLLDSFVEEFAIDLPKFMNATNKEKANTLLQIIGVGDKLAELDQEEKTAYDERLQIGRIKDQKRKFANEQAYYPDAPKELISASDLIKKQQDILAQNGENQRKRERLKEIEAEYAAAVNAVEELKKKLDEAERRVEALTADLETAKKSTEDLHDESTEELEKSLLDIENINAKVRANLDKEKAVDEAKAYESQYEALDAKIDGIRKQRIELLNSADLPLPGLAVQDGEIVYKGQKWDNMSGAEQLKAATAIVRKLNPSCGFVLLDKLEQMDIDTLNEFGEWLEAEGLQAIATRVSTGADGECSIIIEDGYVKGEPEPEPKVEPTRTWKAGEF